jgi:hypothetical protein
MFGMMLYFERLVALRSGKTHTMEGPSIDDPELRGIIPRTVSSLFEGVGRADPNLEFTVKVRWQSPDVRPT